MPKRRFRSPLHYLLHKLGHKPRDLIKVLPYLFLILTLWLALSGFGGFMEYGSPMEAVSYALLGLTGMHAIVVLFRRESLGLGWEAALPVPFLLLAMAHYGFYSPAPWTAGIRLVVLIEAYLLFLVVYNSILSRSSALFVLFSCEILIYLALVGGFFQFYLRPEGMMPAGRLRIEAYSHGMGGFLLDPQLLASMFILIWPLTVLVSSIRRFPSSVRVFNVFGALTLPVGIFMTANRWEILVFLGVALAIPVFVTGYQWQRRKLWLYGTAVLAFLLALCWHVTQDLQQRILQIIVGTGEGLNEASRIAATREFLDAPFLGQGLGSFGLLWDTYNPGLFSETSLYAPSGILHLLAECGLPGLLLMAVPFLFFLVRAWKQWRRSPFVTYDPDVLRRMKHFSTRTLARNKLARKQSYHSSHKILLGGLILGMSGFAVCQAGDYSILFPFCLFLLACLTACLAVVGNHYQRRVVTRPLSQLTGIFPVLVAVGCCYFGIPRFQAQHLYYTGNEKLQSLLKDPDRIFDNPEILEGIQSDLQKATELAPGHAEAWIALAECRMASVYAEEKEMGVIAATSEIPLIKAMEITPGSWKANYLSARTTILCGGDVDRAIGFLETARALAPRRPEPDAFLGVLLLMEDSQSERGMQLVTDALVKYPHYELALRLKPWIELIDRSGDASGNRQLDGVLVTPAFIARLFAPLPNTRERVMGAGTAAGYP